MAGLQSRRVRAARRRKRRMDPADNDLTSLQWASIQAAWGGCAYCGAQGIPLQKDCVLPLSRGGRYTVENVVPACRSCNASKGNEEVTHWLRRKRFDEGAFLVRMHEVTDALVAEAGEETVGLSMTMSRTARVGELGNDEATIIGTREWGGECRRP